MDDPIVRASKGDIHYFRRTPVELWVDSSSANDDDSVLSQAVKHHHIHCAKIIYGRCPELLHRANRTNKHTVLHHAAWRAAENPSLIKFVISVADTKLYRLSSVSKSTPLQMSISLHYLEAVHYLIEADPDHLSYVDEIGQTPLLNALEQSYRKTDDHVTVKIRRILLEKQPSSCRIRTGDAEWTALHHATSEGDLGAIQDIIQFCPDSVHMVDKEGRDFLDICIKYNHSEVMKKVLQRNEIWDIILKGNSIEGQGIGLGKLSFFKLGHGKWKDVSHVANTMSKREKELCIPPNHVELYRELVNQFGEIIEPSELMEEDPIPIPMYEALGCFLNDVSEMFSLKTGIISQREKMLNSEKMATEYSARGLQVSWFQNLCARYSDWFAKREKHLCHFEEIAAKEAYIATKSKEYEIKYSELDELDTELNELESELNELHEQQGTFNSDSDPFLLNLQIICD